MSIVGVMYGYEDFRNRLGVPAAWCSICFTARGLVMRGGTFYCEICWDKIQRSLTRREHDETGS